MPSIPEAAPVRLALAVVGALVLTTALLCVAPAMTAASPERVASPPAPAAEGLWSDASTPRVRVSRSTGRTTVGLRFRVGATGVVTGVQFYGNRATRGGAVGRLWTRGGKFLSKVRFTDARGAGWHAATFTAPVPVEAGRTYVASYTARRGKVSYRPRSLSKKDPRVRGELTGLRGLYAAGSTFPSPARRHTSYFVDVAYRATRQEVAPPDSKFPGPDNTGVPPGTVLSDYTGPMTITTDGTVIDAARITGDLRVMAKDVTVKNSTVFGNIRIDPGDSGYSMTVMDTEIDAGRARGEDAVDGTGIGARDFVALRVDVKGGKRSINCFLNCQVQDSWLHDQASDPTGIEHESAIRMGSGSQIIHNTLLCNAPDFPPEAGCSASLTGYGDFAPVQDNLIQNNYFPVTTGGTCAYGGSSGGKPYSSQAQGIRFIDNVFERGERGYCGYYATIMDFDRRAPGNEWSGNTYANGQVVNP